jgi:glycosyltransferase involved in cell wall biosynthesis
MVSRRGFPWVRRGTAPVLRIGLSFGPMKILMVARRYPPDVRSGTETVFENLYRQARVDNEVRLVVGYRRGRQFVPPEAVAVDLSQGGRARGYAALWWRTRREIASWRPDVVLSNSIEAPVTRVPVACIVHDLNFGRPETEQGLGIQARRAYYRFKARGLERIITVSEASKRNLVAAGLPAARTVAIRNGVDLSRFVPPAARDTGDERFVLAYPSRIIEGKGQHLAIDAVARLPSALERRVLLRIVGTAPDSRYLDFLRTQAEGHPVEFHVDVPDIVPWYQRCDAVLFPTMMTEGFGFTAVEGMACGRPVIWSDQPPVREATGGIGVPFRQGDVGALRDAIAQLMDQPERCARLGREGRAFVDGHYDWSSVWRRYETVLASMG